MNKYLKNIFRLCIMAGLFAIPAQAQLPPPTSSAAAAAAAAPAPAMTGGLPPQIAPSPGAADKDKTPGGPPTQTDIVDTDHTTAAAAAAASAKQMHYYNYAHDEAEYSVALPDAPTVTTIWGETPDTKAFLKASPSDHAALGELATYKLVDMDTEEMFDVKIMFLRASPAFLESLDETKIKRMLEKKFKEVALSNETFNISNGTSTLKWAQLTGFVLDNHHHPAFCAIHYLTGQQSILVVQVRYSLENKHFQEYYNHMVNNITYVQP